LKISKLQIENIALIVSVLPFILFSLLSLVTDKYNQYESFFNVTLLGTIAFISVKLILHYKPVIFQKLNKHF